MTQIREESENIGNDEKVHICIVQEGLKKQSETGNVVERRVEMWKEEDNNVKGRGQNGKKETEEGENILKAEGEQCSTQYRKAQDDTL